MRSTKLFVTVTLATLLLAACSQSAPMMSQSDVEATVNAAVQQTQTIVALSATPTIPPPTETAVPTETPEEIPATATPAEEGSTAPAAPPASGDWNVQQGSDGNFEISLPPDWSYIDMTKGALGDKLAELLAQNPQMKEMYTQEAIEAMVKSGIKFYAIEATADSLTADLPTSLNIILTDLGVTISLDEYTKMGLDQITQMYGDIQISSQVVNFGDVQALEIRYQAPIDGADGVKRNAALVQYIVLKDTSQYLLTFVGTAEHVDANYETFLKIAQSFKFTQ